MEIIPVLTIIISAAILTNLKLLIGYFNTPPNTIYLGTVHFYADYFYYLSQIVQGQTNWFCTEVLQTPEPIGCTYVGFINVFMGRIFNITGLSAIAAYHVICTVWFVVFSIFSYILIKQIFPLKSEIIKRLGALIFFLFATSFSVFDKSTESWVPVDFWYNMGNRFTRFAPVPHHFAGTVFFFLAVILTNIWITKKHSRIQKIIIITGIFFSGFMLAGVNTVHWAVLTFIIAVTGLIYYIYEKIHNHSISPIRLILPALVLFSGGFPLAWYLKNLMQFLPFRQMIIWESQSHFTITLWGLLLGYGPVILPAFLGMVLIYKSLSYPKLITGFIPLTFFVLYLSSIPRFLNFNRSRFLPISVSLFLGILAVISISWLTGISGRLKKLTSGIILSLLLFFTLHTYYLFINFIPKPDPGILDIYLPSEAYDVFQKAQKVSDKSDVFLNSWPYQLTFPALFNRKSFWGDPLMTINNTYKESEAAKFFYLTDISDQYRTELLKKYNIKYVIEYNNGSNILENLDVLEKVYFNSRATLYKVN